MELNGHFISKNAFIKFSLVSWQVLNIQQNVRIGVRIRVRIGTMLLYSLTYLSYIDGIRG